MNQKMSKKNFVKTLFAEIISIKCEQTDRDDSKRTILSIQKLFFEWLSPNKTLQRFNRADAIAFLDWYATRKVSAVSWNNRLAQMKWMFGEMVMRGLISVNPFQGIRKRFEIKKERAYLSEDDVTKIGKALLEHHYWLFIAFILLYYAFIRPAELRRLRFSDFNLIDGYVHIRANVAKNKRSEFVTIPDYILTYLRDVRFSGNPVNHYVFGKNFEPHATILVSVNAMRQKFKRVTTDLGITIGFYDMKDIGITDMANDPNVSIFETSKQARHRSTEMTMRYYRKDKVNPTVKKYGKKLF
jgi:integrase